MVQTSLERLWVGIQNSPDPLLLTPAHSLPCISLGTCRYIQNCSNLWLFVSLKIYKPTSQQSDKSIGAEKLSSLLEHPTTPSYVLGTSRWLNTDRLLEYNCGGAGRLVVRKEECSPELEGPYLLHFLKIR